jgi:transcriptional regulator with XRE-family HTH domain
MPIYEQSGAFMNLGKEIQRYRTQANMTQADLAEKLHVSRSTISNWEIGRNYPDIQSILSLSSVLNIPLETLLREDNDVVGKIANDTRIRKKQTKKILLLCTLLMTAAFLCIFILYKSQEFKDISSSEQISKITFSGSDIKVKTKLPRYRSTCGYFLNLSQDRTAVEISLQTKLDFSMKNEENLHIILDPEIMDIDKVKTIRIVNDGKVIKTLK